MDKVWALMEISPEEAYTHSVYSSRKAALKSGLALIRKEVESSFDFYKQTGETAAEWCYRNPVRFDRNTTYLWVEEMTIYD